MLQIADLKTHLYAELVTAISRDDETIMQAAIAAAEQQAKGYLGRYNIAALFGTTGASRDPLLLMYLKDLAAWHFITLANANIDMSVRKSRFDDAIDALKNIQAGKVFHEDWPLPAVVVGQETENDIFQISSEPKRGTRY